MPLDSSPIAEPVVPASHHAPHHAPHNLGGARPNLKRRQSTIPTPPQTQRKRVPRVRHAGSGMGKVGKLVFPGQQQGQPARKRVKLGTSRDAHTLAGEPGSSDVEDASGSHAELPFLNPLIQRGAKTPSPPSTPQRKASRPPAAKKAEEEDNPFLVTPEEEERMILRRREREVSGESGAFGFGGGGKTVTMVFRGVRQEMPNPYYNRPPNPQAAQLPLSHPDYSPPPFAAPRLLFPPGQSRSDTQAALDKERAGGKMRQWVGNVELERQGTHLPTPATDRVERREPRGLGLGLGLGLGAGVSMVDEPMDLDDDGQEEGVERVVRMMPLVGRQGRGRENVAQHAVPAAARLFR